MCSLPHKMVLAVEGSELPIMGDIQGVTCQGGQKGRSALCGRWLYLLPGLPPRGLAHWDGLCPTLLLLGAGGVLSAQLPKGLLQVSGHHPAVPLQGAREESHQQTSR